MEDLPNACLTGESIVVFLVSTWAQLRITHIQLPLLRRIATLLVLCVQLFSSLVTGIGISHFPAIGDLVFAGAGSWVFFWSGMPGYGEVLVIRGVVCGMFLISTASAFGSRLTVPGANVKANVARGLVILLLVVAVFEILCLPSIVRASRISRQWKSSVPRETRWIDATNTRR